MEDVASELWLHCTGFNSSNHIHSSAGEEITRLATDYSGLAEGFAGERLKATNVKDTNPGPVHIPV